MNEFGTEKISQEQLNEIAMKIILCAGDGRALMCEAMEALENADDLLVDSKMREAKKKVTEAHNKQTDVIQKTVMTDDFQPTLLFIHAQDTLMTISSELYLMENIIRLYRKGISERKL